MFDAKESGQSDFAENPNSEKQKLESKISPNEKVASHPSNSFQKAGSNTD